MKLKKTRANYVPQPVTRLEKIWASMAGVYSPTPDPVKRIEYWMTKTAERIDGGGSGLNEAAGGYIRTDGQLVLWCNAKQASNNYRVRVNVTYEGA